MKKLLLAFGLIVGLCSVARAEDANAYFKCGPLELNIPFKVAKATYLYDFHANQSLVGGETPIVKIWDRIEGDVGVVTSLEGQGTPFVGGNILIGNVLDNWVTLPSDFALGGFGGYDFRAEVPMYGLKASYKVW